MGCRTMRPNASSRNLALGPASIPCLRRSSAGISSVPFEVNVALASFMAYMITDVRHSSDVTYFPSNRRDPCRRLLVATSERPSNVLPADHLALGVEPHHLILRLEDGVVVLVNVFVGATRRCRRHAPARPFTRRLATQPAHCFVGVAKVQHRHGLLELSCR